MAEKARNSGNQRKGHRSAKKSARTRVSGGRRGARGGVRRKKTIQGRVRVARSSARARAKKIAARKPQRPLPPAEMLSERLFLSSLDRSLRDNRLVWEALAKR